jgi:sulfite reductase beta subunit-like hemoprotein
MGLAPTRDLARRLLAAQSASLRTSFAISGCPNSCSQPQLADFGIVATRLAADETGNRTPRFDLYRRSDDTLGSRIAEQLTDDELLASIASYLNN